MQELAKFFTQQTYRTLCATGTAASFGELANRFVDVDGEKTNAEVILSIHLKNSFDAQT